MGHADRAARDEETKDTLVNFWTDEMIDRLRELVAEYQSKDFVAITRTLNAQFGTAFSVPACIGKIYRIRNGRGTKKPAPAPPPRPKTAKIRHSPNADLTPTLREVRKPHVRGKVPVIDLHSRSCRWIDGYDHLHCGDTVVDGTVYCLQHCGMAYRPPGSRDRVSVPK